MNIDIPNARPPFSGAGKKIESTIRKALFDFKMLDNAKQSIAIALSGGKDSLLLLFMLKAILGRGFKKLNILAIHIDGDFSCGASYNRSFLKAICKKIDVNIIFKELKINIKKTNCYSCSRQRRKLIFDIAKENGIDTIAFGHHRDDNIQTLLLNLFHKAEFEGMLANINLKTYGITIIRPLIYVSEKEIINFAKRYNFLKTVCKCPIGQVSKRKDITRIINEIEESFPNIKTNLSKSSFIYSLEKAKKI